MNRSLRSFVTVCTVLFASAAAHAAPIATLACSGYGKTGTATANLSAYTLASEDPISTSSSGSGAGKVENLPLTVNAALSQFQNFYTPYIAGATFSNCMLSSSVAGQAFKIELKEAHIRSFSAVASNNAVANGGSSTASAYITFTVVYQSIAVETTGSDDGGVKQPVTIAVTPSSGNQP